MALLASNEENGPALICASGPFHVGVMLNEGPRDFEMAITAREPERRGDARRFHGPLQPPSGAGFCHRASWHPLARRGLSIEPPRRRRRTGRRSAAGSTSSGHCSAHRRFSRAAASQHPVGHAHKPDGSGCNRSVERHPRLRRSRAGA
eukprot:scaffold11_cov257-Pinguiococcus_pyrenoidosus.AAC.46